MVVECDGGGVVVVVVLAPPSPSNSVVLRFTLFCRKIILFSLAIYAFFVSKFSAENSAGVKK